MRYLSDFTELLNQGWVFFFVCLFLFFLFLFVFVFLTLSFTQKGLGISVIHDAQLPGQVFVSPVWVPGQWPKEILLGFVCIVIVDLGDWIPVCVHHRPCQCSASWSSVYVLHWLHFKTKTSGGGILWAGLARRPVHKKANRLPMFTNVTCFSVLHLSPSSSKLCVVVVVFLYGDSLKPVSLMSLSCNSHVKGFVICSIKWVFSFFSFFKSFIGKYMWKYHKPVSWVC